MPFGPAIHRRLCHPRLFAGFIALGIMGGWGSTATWGQEQQPLERLEVVLWPEYDQSGVLVMYRGWLAPDTALPTTVALPMPDSVAVPSAVAKRPIGGDLLLTPYTVESHDGWQWAYVQTDAPEIRLEYYADLATDAANRRFQFEWPGGPAIDQIAYEVMQPLGASDLSVSPGSSRPQLAPDGLVYQREEIGGVPEGGQFFIDVSYAKTSSDLTAANLGTFQPAPPPSVPSSQTFESPTTENRPSEDPADTTNWLFVLPIVLIAGVGIIWLVLRSPKGPE